MSNENCPDCNVANGEKHDFGCDIERCAICGGQLLTCKCVGVDYVERMVWSGVSPGHVDCQRLGLWCYTDKSGYGNPAMNYGHIPCDKDHPKAREDLNRLYTDCRWDRTTKQFELKEAK
jgi:hypothetical protein